MESASFDDVFRSLFNERFGILYDYLHRLTGDAELADDVAQETFVRLYDRGAMPDAPSAWMVSVAHNLVRDEHRRVERRRRLLAIWQSPRSAEPEAEGRLLMGERAVEVHRVLRMITRRQSQLLLLRHAGYSYGEIARALRVAPGSVGTLLVRATKAFVTAYGKVSHASD
ncbi:MAG: sigma-70 family RNA polymerase sigma factor [Gemmatimonadales bacterium]